MPSNNKRINLTVPPDLYERLQLFMDEQGFLCDATACCCLLTRQLNLYESCRYLEEKLIAADPDRPKDGTAKE